MAPGVDQSIQDRWDVLWQWLQSTKRTRADQTQRLRDLKVLLREKREVEQQDGAAPAQLIEKIDGLRGACLSPFVADPKGQLYACRSGLGLVFIHDQPGRFQKARKQGAMTTLFSLGVEHFGEEDELHETVILDYVTLPRDQVVDWGHAAAVHGYLFALAPRG